MRKKRPTWEIVGSTDGSWHELAHTWSATYNVVRLPVLIFAMRQVAHEQHLKANSRLKHFTVRHYNHAVKYDADGFVERNRDKLHTSVAKLLGASTNNMVRRYDLKAQHTLLISMAYRDVNNSLLFGLDRKPAPRKLKVPSFGCTVRSAVVQGVRVCGWRRRRGRRGRGGEASAERLPGTAGDV